MEILFVCTGNTCRSPMAEGILRALGQEKGLDIEVESAGIAAFAGSPPAENAVKAMEELGIDIRDHRASLFNDELAEKSDLILTMSKSHKDMILNNFPKTKVKIFTLKEYAEKIPGDVIDPFGGTLKIYQDTRDEIAELIRKIVKCKL